MPITVSGTAITFNDATTQTTAFTGGGGTVTSVATGNGLQGGTITTSGTLSVACPTQNTVGSYCYSALNVNNGQSISFGTNYAAGTGVIQIQAGVGWLGLGENVSNILSGTWKWMSGNSTASFDQNGVKAYGIACRVS
jgi:hypothetical protein